MSSRMSLSLSLALALCFLFTGCSRADENAKTGGLPSEFYVSPSGDDAHPGTLDKPFKTLVRAREAVRSVKWGQKSGKVKDITVYLRGGRHYISQPVRFDENDSSNFDCKITYRNYVGETPVLVGGFPVTEWEPYKGGIYRAYLPEMKRGLIVVSQLLENGMPAAIARTPDEGFFRTVDPGEWTVGYNEGDFDPTDWDTDQLQIHMMETGSYFANTIPLDWIDPKTRTMKLRYRSYYHYMMKPGKTYFLQNALALLDSPGEFYADKKTGWLYYKPRSKDIKQANIEAIHTDKLLWFEPQFSRYKVHDITIEGLELNGSSASEFSSFYFAEPGENGQTLDKDDTDRTMTPESRRWAQIYIKNADRVTIKDCRLLNAGNNGVAILGASTGNMVTGCEISHSGLHGVDLFGDLAWYRKEDVQGPLKISHGNTIHNNYIHNVGRLSISGCGITICNTADNMISNNLITDNPKMGIVMFSQWDTPLELATMTGNVIKNNEFARCVNSSTDGGAFYVGATAENTVFENNRIVDVWSWLNVTWTQPEDRPCDWAAIDFDPGMTHQTHIRNNLVYGENSIVMELGVEGKESILENNYFELPERRPNEEWETVVERFYVKNNCAEWRTYDYGTKQFIEGIYKSSSTFDPSKVSMDIGLTKEYKNPYPKEFTRPIKLPIQCGFEGTLSPFYLYAYNGGHLHEYFTNANVKEGKHALVVDKDVFVVRYRHTIPQKGMVSIWMYDDPAKTKANCMVTLRGMEETYASIGVDGTVSPDHYVVKYGGKSVTSAVKRTKGWHQILFDLNTHPDRGCGLSIDGRTIGDVPNLKEFTTVEMGDPELGSDSRGLGFDNVRIGM